MRDIFEEIYDNQPIDPIEAARRSVRTQLRKRFYERATTSEQPEGFAVMLDGRPVRTPARRPLAAPAQPIADAIAAEWQEQQDVINPTHMPLTRLANAIIDGVVDAPQPVADEIAKYLASDLLFYRAEAPEGLVARQTRLWDPVLGWARDALGARFVLAEGVVFVTQTPTALEAARAAIPRDPWLLGALDTVTTLTGSALLALALLHRQLTAEEVWQAAHVDEDWNMEFWGSDNLALERRSFRFAEMQAAALVVDALTRKPS